MKLLILLVAFLLSHYLPGIARLRWFGWYRWWATKVIQSLPLRSGEILVLIIVGVPTLVLSAVLLMLIDHNHLLELLVSTLVLAYCRGPDSVRAEVKALQDKATRSREAARDAQDTTTENAEVAEPSTLAQGREPVTQRFSIAEFNAVDRITQATLERWFAVFFWFLVLGIPGALLYRLTERLSVLDVPDHVRQAAATLKQILEYPVSWLMVISLAIVSDFEKIWEIKKRYLNWENIKQLQQKFLYQSMEFAVANCLGSDDPECRVSLLERTSRLTWRMLVVWFVVLSLLVIAGF
jgi:AmpE protein